jgi:hypothetical protein
VLGNAKRVCHAAKAQGFDLRWQPRNHRAIKRSLNDLPAVTLHRGINL